MMKSFVYKILLFLTGALLVLSCERDFITPEKNKLTKTQLYDVMREWYLWYEHIPEVNPNDYSSLNALLDAIVYKPTDKWSYVIATEEYDLYYNKGEYIGHGIGLVREGDGSLWVGFTYDGSTAQDQGVSRGWEILSINGEPITPESEIDTLLGDDDVGVENVFSFRTTGGQSTTLTLAKEIIDINSVLHSEVIEHAGTKVGYLVYQQFIVTSVPELDTVFSTFLENNVKDVIVDLRYNPGGQVDVAQYLGSLLAGEFAIKRAFVNFEYNDKQTQRNITKTFLELDQMLNPTPDRLFFITTGGSASASELVINSLLGLTGLNRPLEIYLVGDDTHGKPVGSIGLRFNDSTLIPITFRYTNRLGEGEFFEGLPADSYVEEDITKDFGDPDEKLLKEVLYFIENDEFTGSVVKKSRQTPPLGLKGIHAQTGAI